MATIILPTWEVMRDLTATRDGILPAMTGTSTTAIWGRLRPALTGEPGFEDNLRFELHNGGGLVYDSFASGDFPGESSVDGTARNYLDRGNIQVQDLR